MRITDWFMGRVGHRDPLEAVALETAKVRAFRMAEEMHRAAERLMEDAEELREEVRNEQRRRG